MNIKATLKTSLAVLALLAVAACSFLDGQADKRLGTACTDEIRVARAAMLTDMLDGHYGAEFGTRIERLKQKVMLMHRAVAAGDGIDAAGDSYKADFVGFAGSLLAKRGLSVAIGGYDEAVERLKKLPELVADINEIEAKVRIACAELAASGT
jgi:hypothetical protein